MGSAALKSSMSLPWCHLYDLFYHIPKVCLIKVLVTGEFSAGQWTQCQVKKKKKKFEMTLKYIKDMMSRNKEHASGRTSLSVLRKHYHIMTASQDGPGSIYGKNFGIQLASWPAHDNKKLP